MAPLARAGEDNEPDKVQDNDTDIAMAQSRFVLDFIRYFVLPAPPAGLRDKVQDKAHDKAMDSPASSWTLSGSSSSVPTQPDCEIKSKIKNPMKGRHSPHTPSDCLTHF